MISTRTMCPSGGRGLLRFALAVLLAQVMMIGNHGNSDGVLFVQSWSPTTTSPRSRSTNLGAGAVSPFSINTEAYNSPPPFTSGGRPQQQQQQQRRQQQGFQEGYQQQRNVPVYQPGPGGYPQTNQGYYSPAQQSGIYHNAADDFDRRMPVNADMYGTYGSGTGFADTMVQGHSRSTWSSNSGGGHGNLVTMETEGRPLHGSVEVWEGPNNTPLRFRVYSEDGRARPFQALVEPSPQNGASQTLSVRNAGPLEFPMAAGIQKTMPSTPPTLPTNPVTIGAPLGSRHAQPKSYYSDSSNGNYLSTVGRGSYMNKSIARYSSPNFGGHPGSQTVNIDGGALKTVSVGPQTPKVKIRLHSEGLPMTALLEVWEGPGHARQVAEIESQDGLNRPFACAIDTYGHGATICVRNLGQSTFPILLTVEPFF